MALVSGHCPALWKQQRQCYQQLPLQGPSPMVPMIARVWGGAGADAEWTDVPVTPLTTCRDLVDCCRDPGDEPCTLVEVSMGHERALSDSERPLEVLQQWRGRGPVRLVLRYTLDHDHDREHDLDLDNQRRLSPHTPLPSQEGVQPSRNGMKEPGPFADTVSRPVTLGNDGGWQNSTRYLASGGAGRRWQTQLKIGGGRVRGWPREPSSASRPGAPLRRAASVSVRVWCVVRGAWCVVPASQRRAVRGWLLGTASRVVCPRYDRLGASEHGDE
ncbi:uncharacterized protein LOC126106265 [Schistocerca cancellata]|uniref:uncharacterized protein LOC126106265 n=1 Tax=Schistocerca cancellata TaxID=274614 RepID=UPI0021175D44|nr:uncharacterized protein LOC126106265 [Schistocerca cancellata]